MNMFLPSSARGEPQPVQYILRGQGVALQVMCASASEGLKKRERIGYGASQRYPLH